MDNFQIETAQNVSIQQQVAGLGERVLAFFVDVCIFVAYSIVASVILGAVKVNFEEEWVFSVVVTLPIFLYHVLWETFNNGQSPGKALVGLQVVRLDGSKPNFSNYLTRWLLRLIDISFTFGSVAIVTILFNGKGQRLGDLAAKTTVITKRRRVTFADVLHVDIEPNYVPKYPQVTILKDEEIQKIKTIYQRSKSRSEHHIILKLSNKIATVLNVTTTQQPMQFIETIIKDYNYYTQN